MSQPSDNLRRVSSRTTKGIPPKHFEEAMSTSRTPPAKDKDLAAEQQPGTSNFTPTQLTPTGQQPSVLTPTQPTNQPHPPKQVIAGTSQAAKGSRSDMDEFKREYMGKINDLQNEFKRQMHAMQNLLVSNLQQIRSEVATANSQPPGTLTSQLQPPPSLVRPTTPFSVPSPQAPPPTIVSTAAIAPPPSYINLPDLPQHTAPTPANHTSHQTVVQQLPQPERPTSAYTEETIRSISQKQTKIHALPLFTGLPEEWQTFFEAFHTTTTEFEYSPLHNIMRLRDALKGRARETVESLLSHSANVDAIIAILKDTFGRPEQLIRSQIEKVRAIPPVVDGNLYALIQFSVKMANMAIFLRNAGGEHHLTNPTLLSELIAKLPTSRRMQWAEKCISLGRSPTIIDFSDWLTNLRRIANMVTDALPSTSTAATRHHQTPTAPNRRYACVSVGNHNCQCCNGECPQLTDCRPFINMSIDDRWKMVKQIAACFTCLKNGHRTQHCPSRRRCGLHGCQRSHHRMLHSISYVRQQNSLASNAHSQYDDVTTNSIAMNVSSGPDNATHSAAVPDNTSREHATRTYENGRHVPPDNRNNSQHHERRNCHATRTRNGVIFFQIVPVKIFTRKSTTPLITYAFVDDGANVSMIDKEFAKEHGIYGKRETLELQWLNDHRTHINTENVNITISGVMSNAKPFTISNVYTSSLSLPVQSCQIGELQKSPNCSHLSDINFADYENAQPKIILSLNHAFLTAPIATPKIPTGEGPIAINTRLGWIIYGPSPGEDCADAKRALHIRRSQGSSETLENMAIMMKDYFEMETFGIKPDLKKLISEADERAIDLLKSTTARVEERYECGLLWKYDDINLPDSFEMAFNRLKTVERKMSRNPDYAKEYIEKIEGYIKKGYAKKLSEREASQTDEKTFYLPHFGVKNPNKAGLRLVFDAAAEINNISLNKNLLAGPDLNQPLISIFFKFRQAPIAVCGDIREMFHQIQTIPADCNSQRFLWRDGDITKPVKTYRMERMIFGATCSPTIAQHIKNFNARHFANESPKAVHGIVDRHYVDDYVDCFQTEEEAIKVLKDVIRIHKYGGFELRNIISNSDAVKKSCGNAASGADSIIVSGEVDRILGMQWQSKTDVFCFDLKFSKVPVEILKLQRKPTKREMLSIVMSIFDPFGYLCDFMVSAKLLMQSLWKIGVDWDEAIPEEIYKRWRMWMEELPKVKEVIVPRCYFPDFENVPVELHIFVDASEEALAAVGYWRSVCVGKCVVSFVAGKTSCAPCRFHSIPKLELQAAVMGIRLKETIMKNHSKLIKNIFFWSDSHTVVQWLRSDHRAYKQYVANRVSEILEFSNEADWRWCPGAKNPADEATRARFPMKYQPGSRWLKGPDFLMQPKSQWPTEDIMGSEVDNSASELRKKFVLVARQTSSIIPDLTRFSSYRKLKRTMAWVFRYVRNLIQKTKKLPLVSRTLDLEEEKEAEIWLCGVVQKSEYGEELLNLRRLGTISAESNIKTLNPFIGADGLLRVRGRIEKATCVSIETREPIILPKAHPFTRLVVAQYHIRFGHINVATVINEVRLRFWVPSLRRLVNSIQSSCHMCRLRRAKPQQPQMGPLPPDRVTAYIRPFSYTGLDFFGPVYVAIRRQREKRWVALFTCLTIRAVHLEIATDLSSDACLICIRNFINRRGIPISIRSDNGTNFVGIPKELQGVTDFLNNDSISTGLNALGIKWLFNTPSNPSEGGVWERLVQSVKKALYTMLAEQAPRLETLHALLIEAENMVNSRPLTHLPVTPEEPDPLTPNHFILGCPNSTQTPAPYEPRLTCLRKQWRVLKNLRNGLWYQWVREYLPELTRRTKWCLPTKPIDVGSLVLICETDMPRSQWRRGRVMKLCYGTDGVARSATVKTSSGEYRRPVSKLAVLDVTTNGEASPQGQFTGVGMS